MQTDAKQDSHNEDKGMPLWRVLLTAILSFVSAYFSIQAAIEKPRFGNILPACLVSLMALLYLYMLSLPLAYWLKGKLKKKNEEAEDAG